MKPRTLKLGALIACGLYALSSCASLPIPDFGRTKKAEATAAEKAGRVNLAIGAQPLEADPAYVDTAIILPETQTISAWPQAGYSASKVIGHVDAALGLEVDWRVKAAQGTDRKRALTSAPVSDGENIYLLDGDQRVKSFSVETGARNWNVQLESGRRRDKRGVGGGVAVSGDTLIVASGFGFVAALSAVDGSQKWRRDLSAPVNGAPTIKDGQIYVVTQNNEIFGMSLATGEVEWSDQAIAESARVLASPSVAAVEDLVVAPYSSGEVIAYLNANGRRLWNEGLSRAGRFTPISAINDIASRPILSQGVVYAASQSGLLVAIDGRTGRRIWAQNIGSVHAPAVIGQYIFIAGVEGQLACLDINTGAVIWASQLDKFSSRNKKKGRITYAGPIIANGRILLTSSTGNLIAFSPQTGEETARVKLGDKVFLEPIVVGNRLIILTDEGRLIAIR